MTAFAERLQALGMSALESRAKGELFERAIRSLPRTGSDRGPIRAYYVPGRIEVLGKHTDYAGGRSLLCAVERGFCLVARARAEAEVQITDSRSEITHVLPLDPELRIPETGWPTYPAAVVRRVARNFPCARRGADIAFLSDLPAATGMSSSSAFVVAVFLALSDINCLEATAGYQQEIRTPQDLAGYLGTVENGESFGSLLGDRGVGTFGGSEDHTAILCSQAGNLKQYSFCPIRHERTVAMPADYRFALSMSGVRAEKTGAARDKYNRAALAARKILEIWTSATGRRDPSLAAAVQPANAVDLIRDVVARSSDPSFPAGLLLHRFEQFLTESTVIIPAAGNALAAGDLERFGTLVDQSQQAAERLLENQVPETIVLARLARDLGAVASSAFGAGFGGAVWALIHDSQAQAFIERWMASYRHNFPEAAPARFFATCAGPAAIKL